MSANISSSATHLKPANETSRRILFHKSRLSFNVGSLDVCKSMRLTFKFYHLFFAKIEIVSVVITLCDKASNDCDFCTF